MKDFAKSIVCNSLPGSFRKTSDGWKKESSGFTAEVYDEEGGEYEWQVWSSNHDSLASGFERSEAAAKARADASLEREWRKVYNSKVGNLKYSDLPVEKWTEIYHVLVDYGWANYKKNGDDGIATKRDAEEVFRKKGIDPKSPAAQTAIDKYFD